MPVVSVTPEDLEKALLPYARKIDALEKRLAKYEGNPNIKRVKIDVACKMLCGVSDQTVRRYIAEGKIKKAQKITDARNSPYTFDIEELEYLQNNPHLLK